VAGNEGAGVSVNGDGRQQQLLTVLRLHHGGVTRPEGRATLAVGRSPSTAARRHQR
jgi:hypothetical protein